MRPAKYKNLQQTNHEEEARRGKKEEREYWLAPKDKKVLCWL